MATNETCPGCGWPVDAETRTERCNLGAGCKCGGGLQVQLAASTPAFSLEDLYVGAKKAEARGEPFPEPKPAAPAEAVSARLVDLRERIQVRLGELGIGTVGSMIPCAHCECPEAHMEGRVGIEFGLVAGEMLLALLDTNGGR